MPPIATLARGGTVVQNDHAFHFNRKIAGVVILGPQIFFLATNTPEYYYPDAEYPLLLAFIWAGGVISDQSVFSSGHNP